MRLCAYLSPELFLFDNTLRVFPGVEVRPVRPGDDEFGDEVHASLARRRGKATEALSPNNFPLLDIARVRHDANEDGITVNVASTNICARAPTMRNSEGFALAHTLDKWIKRVMLQQGETGACCEDSE